MSLQRIPKACITFCCEIPEDCRNLLLKLALAVIKQTKQDRTKIVENISSEYKIPISDVYDLLGVYLAIVQLFMETPVNTFEERLLELGFTLNFVKNLPLMSSREEVINMIIQSRKKESRQLVSFVWKIDISMPDNVILSKVPKTVLILITLKGEQKYTIRIDSKTFHKLRYNVALVLKELTSSRSISALKQSI